MFVPRHVSHRSVRTNCVEHPSHECTTYKYGEHRLPACNARCQQQDSTEGDGNYTRLTNGTRYQTRHHIPGERRNGPCSGSFTQRGSYGKSVNSLSHAEDRITRYPNGITGHLGRICEEQECTSNQGNVEYVHTRTTKHFLSKNYRECSSYRQNPQRAVYRNNHRNKDTGNKETFLDFFFLPLSHYELNTETYYIRYNDFWQYSQETVGKQFNKATCSTGSMEMLITHVIHTEQQRRYQRNDHHRHNALAVDSVVNMRSRFRSLVGDEQECLESVEHRLECVVFTALFKVRLYLVEIIS